MKASKDSHTWYGIVPLFLIIALLLWKIFRSGSRSADQVQTIPVMYKLVLRTFPNPNMAAIVTAQAILETQRFTSPSYLTKNNAFGAGGEGNLMSFATVSDSVEWLKSWLVKHNLKTDYTLPTSYVVNIKSQGYFTASLGTYLAAIKTLTKEVRKAVGLPDQEPVPPEVIKPITQIFSSKEGQWTLNYSKG